MENTIAVYGILRISHMGEKTFNNRFGEHVKSHQPCIIKDVKRLQTSIAYRDEGHVCNNAELIQAKDETHFAALLEKWDAIEGHPRAWHRVSCEVILNDGTTVKTQFYEAPTRYM